MKHKVSELEGALLDAAVAKAEGVPAYVDPNSPIGSLFVDDSKAVGGRYLYSPSTDWWFGGPIIERERIGLWAGESPYHGTPAPAGWFAEAGDRMQFKGKGPTPLIAAMRCFVASKLGEEMEL